MNKKVITGFVVGLLLEVVSIILLSFFYKSDLSLGEYLGNAFRFKTIVKLGAIACVPNIVLFFALVNQHKINLAKGVQYFIIALVVFLAVVKFVL